MPDNNEWIINPLPEIGPINSVVPWTYGDAYSFLEILTETREKMQEILKGFKIQDKHIRDFVNDVSNKINEFVAKFVHHTVTEDDKGIIHFAMMNGSEILTYTTKQFDKVFTEYKTNTDKWIREIRAEILATLEKAQRDMNTALNEQNEKLTKKIEDGLKAEREFAERRRTGTTMLLPIMVQRATGKRMIAEQLKQQLQQQGKEVTYIFRKASTK